MTSVCVVIPSIPPRSALLLDAINSVTAQTHPVAQISVAIDHDHEGAWVTRNRAALASHCEWTTFLDDDDQYLPHHVAHLLDVADEHRADFVWSWFEVVNGTDPFPFNQGRQYEPGEPVTPTIMIIPIPFMCRTELLHAAIDECGGWVADPNNTGSWNVQDQTVIDVMWKLCDGRFFGSPERTWKWFHHGRNSSGCPQRVRW